MKLKDLSIEETIEKFNNNPNIIIIMFKLVLGNLNFQSLRLFNKNNYFELNDLKEKFEAIFNINEDIKEIKEIKEIKKEIELVEKKFENRIEDILEKEKADEEKFKKQNPEEILAKLNQGYITQFIELGIIVENFKNKKEFFDFFEKKKKYLYSKLRSSKENELYKFCKIIEKKFLSYNVKDCKCNQGHGNDCEKGVCLIKQFIKKGKNLEKNIEQ